jgi:hypothetical protein
MAEWLLVKFPDTRGVLVDDTICGSTNAPMMVQLGTHLVTLDGAQDFDPPEPQKVRVFGTSQQAPKTVTFTKQ